MIQRGDWSCENSTRDRYALIECVAEYAQSEVIARSALVVRNVTTKTKILLKSFGVFLAVDALMFGSAYIAYRLATSSIGRWLEVDKPTLHSPAGLLYVVHLAPLMIAFFYYRDKMKATRKTKRAKR